MLLDILVLLIIFAILVLPVKLAADYVGARNTGILMCVAALLLAGLIQTAVESFFPLLEFHYVVDSLVSILLSALAYMAVLGTTYGKGIAIAILQIILTFVLVAIVGMLGVSVGTVLMQV